MNAVAAAVITVGGIIVVLAALLRLGKAAGERLARGPVDVAPVRVRPAVAPGPGALSEEERALQQWAADATRRDLERLAAAHRVFEHGLNRLFEQALRDLQLDQTDRNWARIVSGDDHLVGVQ